LQFKSFPVEELSAAAAAAAANGGSSENGDSPTPLLRFVVDLLYNESTTS